VNREITARFPLAFFGDGAHNPSEFAMETQKTVSATPPPHSRRPWIFAACAILALIFSVLFFHSHARRTQETRLIRELMLLQEAVKQFAAQTGNGGTDVPSILPKKNLEAASSLPIGGQWRIQRVEEGARRGTTELIIDGPSRTIKEMERLDAAIDDGNLAAGTFTLKGLDAYSIRLLERGSEDEPEPEQKSPAPSE
jgi:hypothetical protein